MTWSKLSITVDNLDRADIISHALQDLIESLAGALTIFEDGPGRWRIDAYFADAPISDAVRAVLEARLERPPPDFNVTPVPDLNWVALSQAALPPVTAGRFVVHGSHDRGRVRRGPNAILIDAAEAFGTAHHPTTLGCLIAIDRLTRRRTFASVLDLGCGSGILAIAAARALPNARILATDSDSQSVAVAAGNMRGNGVGRRIRLARAAGLGHPLIRRAAPFDLVMANILAGPLIALAPRAAHFVTAGGAVILSGLLIPEAPAVTAAYRAAGFRLSAHLRIEGWSTLTLLRAVARAGRHA